jgi:macrodomain Ter protein organizer (MatP/YcbG family)
MTNNRDGRVHVEIYFEVRERVARLAKRRRLPQYKVLSELVTKALDEAEKKDREAYDAQRQGRDFS